MTDQRPSKGKWGEHPNDGKGLERISARLKAEQLPSKELERELEENLARARQRVNEVFNNGWADGAILHLVTAFYALQNYRERASQPPEAE